LTEVKTCSNAIFEEAVGHGKSPWFLRCAYSDVADMDSASAVFGLVSISKLLD